MVQNNRRRNVLIVEDNADDVQLTREAFEECEVNVELVALCDGVEALAFLRREGAFANAQRPDFVILDYNLPRMNGAEVLTQIKSDPSLYEIPVVMLSTSKSIDHIRTAYELRANSYIVKPIDFDEFIDVVNVMNQFWFKTAVLPGDVV